ncbi:hypothetical protein KIN20_029002 [Parelaphostrongylus tenuis]|uniref:Uncharacterized protein n=1 Tax=Parelaphostrongylus tenuis TaxID=148309 RepID=A0AAD5R2E0_PARTN|nr:hypothetical protein KIN20_029002 [Parelaphostrongylus tenuis]
MNGYTLRKPIPSRTRFRELQSARNSNEHFWKLYESYKILWDPYLRANYLLKLPRE